MFTEQQILQLITDHEILHDLADQRASEYLKALEMQKGITIRIEFNDGPHTFWVNGGLTPAYYVRYEEYWKYGGHEEYGQYIPLSMLWAPEETIAYAKEMMEKEAQRLLDIEADTEQKRIEARERHDRAEFKRLQKKYVSSPDYW